MSHQTHLTQLLQSCRTAIRKGNLEKCFELLDETLAKGEEVEDIRNQLIVQEGRLNFALRERNAGRADEYNKVYSQIADFMLSFLGNLDEKHLTLLNSINDQILILTYVDKEDEWDLFFPEKHFSHAKIVSFGKEIPANYRTPDVILFDDTGPSARPYMVQCAAEMPQAHFLYFGDINPFTESRKRNPQDAAIFDRCANANSKFTVHARLRELLEFRKIYGIP